MPPEKIASFARRAGWILGLLTMLFAGLGMAEQAIREGTLGWAVSGIGCLVVGVAFFLNPSYLVGSAGAEGATASPPTARRSQVIIVVGGFMVVAGIFLRLFA